MKFIYADSLDFIDPRYDFVNDCHGAERRPYWDDKFAHEIFSQPPYDGILVSRGIVGDHKLSGKYSESQSMRFRRVGARKFLRLDNDRLKNKPIFGDCGAFTYHNQDIPPYTSEEMLDFYADGQFDFGCSIDHVVFEFDPKQKNMDGGSEQAHRRFEITQENARDFLKLSKDMSPSFTPIGIVQGWSPSSMAHAAVSLCKMGYKYIAVGGMVPLPAPSIHICLDAISSVLQSDVKLHLLGFAKAEQIKEFTRYPIASFDSTSPLLRAFKDNKSNYYVLNDTGGLSYYSAIRIPHSLENNTLKRRIQEGLYRQEDLTEMENHALACVRNYDCGKTSLEETLDAVLMYAKPLILTPKSSIEAVERRLDKLKLEYLRTLKYKPWQACRCAVCRTAGVEAIIFRSSNRNKRRGMHNLSVYYQHVKNNLGRNVSVN